MINGEWKTRFPKALIVGAANCGTTTLLRLLGKHPFIQYASSERNFFGNEKDYIKGLVHYVNQMPKSYGNQVTIEKTSNYLFQRYVAKRVFNLNVKMKLIFIFCEFVGRVIFHFFHYKIENKKTLEV